MESDWEPTEEDVVWLKSLLSVLRIGGTWVAPIGFLIRRTGSKELTLVYALDMEDVWETIERIKKTAKKAGIKLIIRVVEP